MSDHVDIFEVGPRDGLQNEPGLIPTADKVALVDLLSAIGFSRIEVASFVSPKWVPQMADGERVLADITRAPGTSYAALTPNLRGYERAIVAKADEIAVFASASEGFSQANINCSIRDSIDRYKPVIGAAKDAKLPVRGYVSCVTDCPFDGQISPKQVANVARALFDMGCYEVSLGDTIGRATPGRIRDMLGAVQHHIPAQNLAGHFHDTAGMALANITASLELDLRVFDSAIAGLGGCPYAPGAPGNLSTQTLHQHLTKLGLSTGLNADALKTAAEFAKHLVNHS